MLVGPPAPHVTIEPIDEMIVLFDSDHQAMFELNHTAAAVWRLCTGEHTASEIVHLMANLYATDPDEIHDEVVAVIDGFVAQGLIVTAPPS